MKESIKIIDVFEKKLNKSIFNRYLNFNGLLIIRNFFNEKEIIDEVKSFRKRKKNYIKISGPYFYKKKNFSRFDKKLVRNKYVVHGRHQYLHTLFTWNKDDSFRNIFKRLISLRNNLYGIRSKKDIFSYKGHKYINLPKILHYPNNGFLGKHIDNSPVQDRNFIIVSSKKGNDFSKGGLFYEINNKNVEIEKFLKIGDIVCNDYKVKHGVKKISSTRKQSSRFSIVLSMHKV